MSQFLGAVFKDDGTIAKEIPRSALGLPGIQTFDSAAERGGVKIEPLQMDVDPPVSFPTTDDIVIGACTCGSDCDCPGCAIHSNGSASADSGHSCGEHCTSTFDLRGPSCRFPVESVRSITCCPSRPPTCLTRRNIDRQISTQERTTCRFCRQLQSIPTTRRDRMA